MLNETEIAAVLKKAYESKLPSWQLDYWKRICHNLQVHTKGLLFSKIDTLFPHEHIDSKIHCINTYEAITKGSIWKAINNVIRIFSNSSFTVSASDTTLEFINANNFCNQNLFSFFIDQWTDKVVGTDPNGLCAVYPQEYIKDYPGDMVRFIKNEHVRAVADDMVVFISEDESTKTYSTQDTIIKREVFYDPNVAGLNACNIVEKTYNLQVMCNITKPVYHVFTKEYFVRFTADNSSSFDYDIYYFATPLSKLPAFNVTSTKLQTAVQVSFVDSFIPFGNLALLQHRNHRAVDLMFSYPRMSEIQTPCDNISCNDGWIILPGEIPGEPTTQSQCSRCRGSGFLTVQSPYKVYQKRIDTGLSDTETIKQLLAAAPVDFHTPDTGILEYSKDSWKGYLSMAEEAVFVQQKQMTGNVESGKAKEIDKEGEYSWIQNISKALNADLATVIQCIENYTQSSPVTVGLEQPISFAVVTETEAFEALDVIMSGQTPVFVKAQQVENFVLKFVSKSSPIVKALKILKLVDPLLFYSNLDVQTFKSNNAVTTEAWTTHIYAYSILMQLYEADKNLFENPDKTIVKMVQDAIPKAAPPALGVKGALLNIDGSVGATKADLLLQDQLS